MYFYGFFQTDVLINFFIPLRQAESITWENFGPGKRDLDSTKEGSHLARIKLFTCNRKIWRIYNTVGIPAKRDRHPGQPRSCNHHLILLKLVFSDKIMNGYWMKFMAINGVTDLKDYLFRSKKRMKRCLKTV